MNSTGGVTQVWKATSTKQKVIFWIVIAIILAGIIASLTVAVLAYQSRPTPENIQAIATGQTNNLITRWNGPYGATKGLTTASNGISEDQDVLINYQVRSTRLCGYLGPFSDGVFEPTLGTRLALNSGARCLIVEINKNAFGQPVLEYLNERGERMSLNSGSLLQVANHLSVYAFREGDQGPPADVAGDPFILVLYFVNTPSPVKNPAEYLLFLGECGKQLQPLRNKILGQTPQGDFRRQGLESQLFYMPLSVVMGKMIILTNVDTTVFRRPGTVGCAGKIDDTNDLDFLVHARIYARQSPSGLGMTSQPESSVSPAAVITTPSYWTSTPPDRVSQAQNETKSAWTIAMEPVANEANTPEAETLTTLYETYGVQSVPFVLFQKEEVTDLFVRGRMDKKAWLAKPNAIRWTRPAPIPILRAMPETNARGGAVMAPTFR